MTNEMIAVLMLVVAIVASGIAYPMALRFARKHNIVDNPNARKLQRVPIPVFGGVVVYTGILIGGILLFTIFPNHTLGWGLVAMTFMMIIGLWDDMRDISATLRFLIEILLIVGFIQFTGIYVDNLHGLWGIYDLKPWIGIPMSVFMGVGIINAINMIDGVDGYSSGYGIMACGCFAFTFGMVWSPVMVGLAAIVMGALLPFFFHNVFGQKSKMFIGDSGTLLLGMALVVLAFYALSGRGNLAWVVSKGMCIPAFLVAIGCIPLFDTVRVMTLRILRGGSPFKPDKTHLHHLFIDMGFSHLGAALFILMINFSVVVIWLISWQAGCSMEAQFYIVVAIGFLVTFGFYKFMKIQQNSGPRDDEGYPEGSKLWYTMCKLGELTHREDKWTWRTLRNIMDGPLSGVK